MTVITSQKESEPTKVAPKTVVDASSVSMGPDSLYQHPPPVDIQDYYDQRRHNRAWLRRCVLHWCGKAILAVSISVMLFALILLLLSWAEGYPSVEHRADGSAHLQRASNLERMEPPSYDNPSILDVPVRRYRPPENETDVDDYEPPSFFNFHNMIREMRQRFQNVMKHMRDLMGQTDSLPAPSPGNNDTQIIRRLSIDGTDFVQTRQVLKKELPDGQGVIVVVRQQLIPVDEFYGNATTAATPAVASDRESAPRYL